MWMMLQAEAADDYVIATGESHSVREFCELAFKLVGMPITWHGEGLKEVGVDSNERERIRIDSRYFRPAEVDLMQGDSTYAREKLGWKPTVNFAELVQIMVEADIEQLRNGDRG
jgi:GDPmannose 4,6-dehydratase